MIKLALVGYYVIWIMDDVKRSIFAAVIMSLAAKTFIQKSGICVW